MINKLSFLLLLLTVATLFVACNKSSVDKSQSVNPILGDISYESKFGHKPDATTDNHLRIKTHLEYVENLLRTKNMTGLSLELQIKRNHVLDLLHSYWTHEKYPKNYDFPTQRKPCFIDKDGTICAVGYLLEQTTNRQIANYINDQYQYEELLSMNDATLDNWILNNGLTKNECAMIQPAYGPAPVATYNYISPEFGISSSILSGVNLSLNTINGIQIGKGSNNNNTVPILGLILGSGQIVLGAAMFPNEGTSTMGNIKNTNESQKTLSIINISLGTTSLILSTWNLMTHRKSKGKSSSWNIYHFPTRNNKTGLALSMRRNF